MPNECRLRSDTYPSYRLLRGYLCFSGIQADIYMERREDAGRWPEPHCHRHRTIRYCDGPGNEWEKTCFCFQCDAAIPFTCGHATCIPQQFEASRNWKWLHATGEEAKMVRAASVDLLDEIV